MDRVNAILHAHLAMLAFQGAEGGDVERSKHELVRARSLIYFPSLYTKPLCPLIHSGGAWLRPCPSALPSDGAWLRPCHPNLPSGGAWMRPAQVHLSIPFMAPGFVRVQILPNFCGAWMRPGPPLWWCLDATRSFCLFFMMGTGYVRVQMFPYSYGAWMRPGPPLWWCLDAGMSFYSSRLMGLAWLSPDLHVPSPDGAWIRPL